MWLALASVAFLLEWNQIAADDVHVMVSPSWSHPASEFQAKSGKNATRGRLITDVLDNLGPIAPNGFGNLHNLEKMGAIVLAPSKTGSSSMEVSLRRALSNTSYNAVFHGHSDDCMHNQVPGTSSLTISDLVEHRLVMAATPIWWGLTFRDPVSRTVSHWAHQWRTRKSIPAHARDMLFRGDLERDLEKQSAIMGVHWRSIPYSAQMMVGGGLQRRPGVHVLVATVEAFAQKTHLEAQARFLGLTEFQATDINKGTRDSAEVAASALQLTEADVNKSFHVHSATLHHFYTAETVEELRRGACERFCMSPSASP